MTRTIAVSLALALAVLCIMYALAWIGHAIGVK